MSASPHWSGTQGRWIVLPRRLQPGRRRPRRRHGRHGRGLERLPRRAGRCPRRASPSASRWGPSDRSSRSRSSPPTDQASRRRPVWHHRPCATPLPTRPPPAADPGRHRVYRRHLPIRRTRTHPRPPPTVLDGVSIRIPAGKRTAIAGAPRLGQVDAGLAATRTWDLASGTVAIEERTCSRCPARPARHGRLRAAPAPLPVPTHPARRCCLAAPDASKADLSALEVADLTDWLATVRTAWIPLLATWCASRGQRQRLASGSAPRDAPDLRSTRPRARSTWPPRRACVRDRTSRRAAPGSRRLPISAVRDADQIITRTRAASRPAPTPSSVQWWSTSRPEARETADQPRLPGHKGARAGE